MNLPFLSKLLERVVSVQLTDYLSSAGLLPMHQSAYCEFHSTETVLLKVVTDLIEAIDAGDHALLGLLDLLAAFDTIDHDVLVERLARTYVPTFLCALCICTYSEFMLFRCEIELICLIFFIFFLYIIILKYSRRIVFECYHTHEKKCNDKQELKQIKKGILDNDTQLHIALSHTDQSGKLKLEECLSSMYAWFCFNGLAINPDNPD